MSNKVIQVQENDESYQAMRERLDGLLEKLQDPDCDVDEAAGLYDEALTVIGKLEAHLEAAENRIKKVKADFGIKGNAEDED